MLYNEFLEGTGAIDTPANYAEYKRVEEIYMAADSMTKADAYRMAVVVTEKDYKKQQKAEIAWVKQNIIPAAAFVRGMSDKVSGFRDSKYWTSDLGNFFELRLERDINCGSVRLYSFWCNNKKIDVSSTGRTLVESAEIQSYRAGWQGKTREELEELFGYIA